MACPGGMDRRCDSRSQELSGRGSGTLGRPEAAPLWGQPPHLVPGGAMGLTALCPGTFDPVTNGHLDVVGRAASTFDAVVVAVVENPSKTPLFAVSERIALLEEGVRHLGNVRVG